MTGQCSVDQSVGDTETLRQGQECRDSHEQLYSLYQLNIQDKVLSRTKLKYIINVRNDGNAMAHSAKS